jgi:uncharacterized protein YkwD
MQRQLLVAVTIAASWMTIAPAAAPAAGCAYARSKPALVGPEKAAKAVVCLVNQERAARGLPDLRANAKLTRSAAGHSRRMAGEDFFLHGRLADRLRAAGWARGHWKASETIGWGMERNSRPQKVVAVWMADPRDRAVLLSRRTEIGVGVARGLPFASRCHGATYTLVVGRR